MTDPAPLHPPLPRGFEAARVRSALPLFKTMALVVGVGLLLLVLEMVLKYGFHIHALDWWQIPHGILFMGYIAAVANLALPARWSIAKTAGVLAAGVVPFLSFFVEPRVARETEAQLAAAGIAPGAGAGEAATGDGR